MHNLFVYGTLMNPTVQRQVFGRIIRGRSDILNDYTMSELKQGRVVYPVIQPATGQKIKGLLLRVSETELRRGDYYEGSDYMRIQKALESKVIAWVYVAAI